MTGHRSARNEALEEAFYAGEESIPAQQKGPIRRLFTAEAIALGDLAAENAGRKNLLSE